MPVPDGLVAPEPDDELVVLLRGFASDGEGASDGDFARGACKAAESAEGVLVREEFLVGAGTVLGDEFARTAGSGAGVDRTDPESCRAELRERKK